jgi:hypothetical protein
LVGIAVRGEQDSEDGFLRGRRPDAGIPASIQGADRATRGNSSFTLGGAYERGRAATPLHLVNAFAGEARLVRYDLMSRPMPPTKLLTTARPLGHMQ